MTPKQRQREWAAAIRKVHEEGVCRRCKVNQHIEAAHVMGREFDAKEVHEDDIIPLCKICHYSYDARLIDVLPLLTKKEQSRAVLHKGMISALKRTAPTGGEW